ncbi:hypothetical protein F4808DRAFT_119038 [Astrocystis sublimbata]|nr:hypothetical protein F4808DRAFT_119038 [Astrocystis sublimbata]
MDPFAALGIAANIIQFIEYGIKLTTKGYEAYTSVHGQTEADRVIQSHTTSLLEFSEQLDRKLSNTHSPSEAAVALLANQCAAEARKMTRILYDLQSLTLGERVEVILNDPSYKTDVQKIEALRTKIANPEDATTVANILSEYQNATDAKQIEVIRKKLPRPNKRKKTASLVAALKSLWKQKEVAELHENLKEYRAQLTVSMVGVMNDKTSSITTLLETLAGSNALVSRENSKRLDDLQTTLAQIRAELALTSKQKCVTDENQSHGLLASQLQFLVNVGDSAITTVLTGLKFESMYTREASVSAAYSQTFEWLFESESSFYDWLSSSSGSFWVSGKPGSGKSTLMKFVTRHEKYQTTLQQWAKGDFLITVSFFFWSSGTPMQKSLQGLLQTLLYQIMKTCPLLIPSIAPERWANALNRAVEEPWTWEEATATFHRFIRQTEIKCSTCLFIDGLDEFDGDHAELVEILSKIPDTSNVKVCLASRPYNEFTNAYGQSPERMIRLQDLTRGDIRLYVNENFEKHTNISHIDIYSEQYNVLVEEIVDKADGVFLWVYLVVRSLKDGMTNADTIPVLQHRLRKLPADLSEYFQHILNSVDEVYWEDTTKVFQMLISAQHPLPPGVLSVLDRGDVDSCLKVDIKWASLQDYETSIRIIERRLNARCKGLLEIRETPGHLWGSDTYHDRYLVHFLHRTVRDFLRNEDVLNLLRSRLSGSFNVDLTLCQGYLLHLKQFIIRDDPVVCRKLSFTKTLDDLVYFSQRHKKISNETPIAILDEALRVATEIKKTNPSFNEETFYSLVVRHGSSQYLEHRFQNNQTLFPTSDQNRLLLEALTPASAPARGIRYDYMLQPSMIRVLLESGAQPNNTVKGPSGETIWSSFVAYMHGEGSAYVTDHPEEYCEASELMLKAGAERSREIRKVLIGSLFPVKHARRLEQVFVELDAKKVKPALSNANAISNDQSVSSFSGYFSRNSSQTRPATQKEKSLDRESQSRNSTASNRKAHAEGQVVNVHNDADGTSKAKHGRLGPHIGSKLRRLLLKD